MSNLGMWFASTDEGTDCLTGLPFGERQALADEGRTIGCAEASSLTLSRSLVCRGETPRHARSKNEALAPWLNVEGLGLVGLSLA